MNFNFDNMNNPNEQLKQDDLNSEEVGMEENTKIEEGGNNKEKMSPEKRIYRVKCLLEILEHCIEEKHITTSRSLESLENEIEKAKKENINLSTIDNFDYRFKNVKEISYLVEIEGYLENARKFLSSENYEDRLALTSWYYVTLEALEKHKDKIDENNLQEFGRELEEIRNKLGDEKEKLKKEIDKRNLNFTLNADKTDDIRQETNSSEFREAEIGTKQEPSLDEIKNEEISPEVENEINTEQEPNSIEMTEEDLAEIEKVNGKEEEEFNNEKRARLEEWDKEENKEQKIAEEKTIIEEELGKRVMKENKELIEQKNIREILKSHDELRSLQNELKEEVKKSIEGRRAASEGIQNQMNQDVDISQLNIGDRMKVETARSEFLKTTKNVLSVKEIDYLLQIGNEAGDLGDLSKTHEKRKIEMEELQKIIKAIEEYKSFMEKFEKLTEEEKEEAREEVGKFIKWLEWVKENKEDLFLALAAMGMIAGAAALVMSVGLPADMAIPAFLTAKNAIIAGGALVAAGAGYYIYKKEKIQATVNAAGMAVALPIVGGAMILDSILSSKKLESWMETLCGTSLPSWAREGKEKS
ncbi:MAG: hypothetical protein KAU07_00305 [Candidatus Andersenbacteria bacterium]|nr:hypothetical protein [Candidatus Andersenbacteria bacterium]